MLPAMPETHSRRREALRTLLRTANLDALLVTDLLNVRYLTGFTGSNAALLVHAEDTAHAETRTTFCTDGRYLTQAGEQVPDLERVIERASGTALAARSGAEAAAHRRTGFESHKVTVDALDVLAGAAEGVDLVRSPGLVEELRLVKDDEEVEALRMACAAADRALAELLAADGLRAGRAEVDVARDLEARMRDNGAAGPSFETIVASGANSAVPHHRPTEKALRTGDLIKIDFGALVDGYHSDMTRTMVLGQPADWQQELYELVRLSQAAGRAALSVGVEVRDVDAAARKVIEAAGRGEDFLHGLGHGVGLEVHEAPSLSKAGDGRLIAGMAVTVEPGVYLSGRGGVRIEDTLVVRDGEPELLTLTTKELVVV
ncbi:Xaa-Pro aminopeptidase [Actinoalloteichus sp. GBA129-24]|uniref:Xaa-Pro aminopeptidase n=2 Tax=Pseudonocardiaceae TaxID=2070 RepID=A0AAC9LAQ9_9PSEU|nr:Xaa-Pro aminopeptidase [Actinoalloteichus fjordicus]APU20461.1 Xaa-Pro aminopeptidase [Actinoalloteichus sp. GBA129-24]